MKNSTNSSFGQWAKNKYYCVCKRGINQFQQGKIYEYYFTDPRYLPNLHVIERRTDEGVVWQSKTMDNRDFCDYFDKIDLRDYKINQLFNEK